MTLRKKVFISIGIVLVSAVFLTYIIVQKVTLQSFSNLEKEYVETNLKRINGCLNNKKNNLARITTDWGFWDATYEFVQNPTEDYINSNMNEETFEDMDLNSVLIINNSQEVIFSKIYDWQDKSENSLLGDLNEIIKAKSDFFLTTDLQKSREGIVIIDEKPLLLSSKPIITSEKNGPSQGWLVLGRLLNKIQLAGIEEQIKLDIEMQIINENILPVDYQEALTHIEERNSFYTYQELSEEEIAGYTKIDNVFGKPILLFKVLMPRDIYLEGKKAQQYFWIILILFGLFFAFFAIIFWEGIFSRLSRLTQGINHITERQSFAERVRVEGKDEMANLSIRLNELLETVEKSRESLVKSNKVQKNLVNELFSSNKKLEDIIEFLPDPTFVVDKKKRVIAWNKAIEIITGVPKSDILGKGHYAYSVPFYGVAQPVLLDILDMVDNVESIKERYPGLTKEGNILTAEVFIESFQSEGKHLLAKASPLFDRKGKIVGAIESIRDITEWKKVQEQIQYLNRNDSLTGLYNRVCFEQYLLELKNRNVKTVAILVGDLDGLKIINDTAGHKVGDEVLKAAAQIFASAARKSDFVARTGGDEFSLIFLNIDEVFIIGKYNEISQKVKEFNKQKKTLKVSMSIGYAISPPEEKPDLKELLKEADNNVYREKLHREQSRRSSIVSVLMKALEARDFITEGHADRLQELVEKIAKHLGLSEPKINEIRLFGQFHDMGKVGIPDRILFKEGPLNKEEIKEMRNHSEIGYRIAMSVPELKPIAEWILLHHEWYNGQGYPKGLKGDEIPLECRILSIADAFDAMISDRPYRKAMSGKAAVQELKRNAGTQFDPQLIEKFISILEEE